MEGFREKFCTTSGTQEAKAVEGLRRFCNDLYNQREEVKRADVEKVLIDWLEEFISKHQPWKLARGNTEMYKFIRIYRAFHRTEKRPYEEPKRGSWYFYWPELDDEVIREELEKLGFIVSNRDEISIAVPAYKKGERLTFAQEWVKKINDNYSVYISKQKVAARNAHKRIIKKLCTTKPENIETTKDGALITGIPWNTSLDRKATKHLITLLQKDGIKVIFEDWKFKGYLLSK